MNRSDIIYSDTGILVLTGCIEASTCVVHVLPYLCTTLSQSSTVPIATPHSLHWVTVLHHHECISVWLWFMACQYSSRMLVVLRLQTSMPKNAGVGWATNSLPCPSLRALLHVDVHISRSERFIIEMAQLNLSCPDFLCGIWIPALLTSDNCTILWSAPTHNFKRFKASFCYNRYTCRSKVRTAV
jgi:hypothetical protein